MGFPDQKKVIIVGAGVAGLVLAQILGKNDISYEIYERDDGTHRQGWAIGLDKCLDALREVLPKDIADPSHASPNLNTGKHDGFVFFDGQTNRVIGIVGNVPPSDPHYLVYANRLAFRDILMEHIPVHRDKCFARYTQDDHGVTAFFTDGSSTHGDILIGADGANSAVRRQLLEGFTVAESKYASIYGDVVLPPDLTAELLREGHSGVIVGQPRQKGFALLMKHFPDGSALFNWTCAYRVDDHVRELAWLRTASREQLLQRARERFSGWPDVIRNVVERTDARDVHQPPIRLLETVLPEDTLPAGRVSLLGDAMHSMVPFRGMGANTGILGACLLGKILASELQDCADPTSLLRKFEQEWIPKSREIVLQSWQAAEDEQDDSSGGRIEATRK